MKIENMGVVRGLALGVVALGTVNVGVGCDGASIVGDGSPGSIAVQAAPASGLAVVGSDFASSVVSLLASDGTLAKDDCIDSGTATSDKLSLALSGDVTLPSQAQRGGKLWIIDRGNAALTILEPTTCVPVGQISVATGFISNPRDVAVLSDTKAYVTRLEKNIAPPSPMAAGDDIIIFDPSTGALTGRIDLSGQASPVAGAAIQARPNRMVITGGKVYVTLNNQDKKFFVAGEGAVVVIDPASDIVVARVALPGLKGCEAITALEDAKKIFVACGGSFADTDQAAGSGIAMLDVGVWPPVLASVTKGTALDGHAVNFSWVGALSATRVLAATFGSFGDVKTNTPGTKDAVFSVDLAAGTGTALGIESGPFDLGRAAVTATTLFVPDASSGANTPRVHVFAVSGSGAATETSAVDADPAKKLPPREIAWY
jgi:hypothetical protein